MSFNYIIPIIPQNLRSDETVVQIADALHYLSQVANDIFLRVNNRIENNNVLLSNLSSRIDTAGVKISKLSGANKATQVFSSSKYPASEIHRRYESIFDQEKLPLNRSKVKYKDIQVTDEPVETLQFFHVKVNNLENGRRINGLGEVPTDIKLINDLLLYNTGKNPYKDYVISDPLQTALRARKDDSVDTSDIGAAPHSISEGTTLTRSGTESYFYSPDLGDVPCIDVPLDLPDLPGIADDLRFINELGPGIAPSVTTTPNVPELPILNDDNGQVNDNLETLHLPLLPSVPEARPVEKVEVTLPQQPLPKETPESVPIESEYKPNEDPIHNESDKSSIKTAVVGDAHVSLMEAIRKAGGSKNANLRTLQPRKSSVPSGDLMADFHAKLSLRRKGISGAKTEDNVSAFDGSSAMNKISAMIPPPPTNIETASTTTEDEDWEE